MSAAPPAIPVEERLFSLVLALLATETGLTKTEILSTVQGYRQRYRSAMTTPTSSGSSSATRTTSAISACRSRPSNRPGDAGNNQTLRYRIPRGAYELPSDISFSSDETTLLNLAAQVWREGSLSGESRRAMLKLRSLGVTADEPVHRIRAAAASARCGVRPVADRPREGQPDRAVRLSQAGGGGRARAGGDPARARAVPGPLAPVGERMSRPDVGKTFLLRRIVGPVRTASRLPSAPAITARRRSPTSRALARAVWRRSRSCDSDAATRLANRRGAERDGNRFTLHYVDAAILADELAGFGPEVLVIAPDRAARRRHRAPRADGGDHG